MDDIETKEQNLIQHIRTAGLQKRREMLLVDEVLELRKAKRKLLTSLTAELENVKEESTVANVKSQKIIKDSQEQLVLIKRLYEEKFDKFKNELFDRYQQLEEENNELKSMNAKYKESQCEHHAKMKILDNKMKELKDIQRRNETTMRQEIESQMKQQLSKDIELKYEQEIMKMKEMIRSVVDREHNLKSIYSEQKVALRAYQKENELLKSSYKEVESQQSTLQKEVYEHKLEYEKLRMKYSALEQKIAKKELEIEEINEKMELKLKEKQEQYDEELDAISKKVKIIIDKKDSFILQIQNNLFECQEEKQQLENALNEINQGISVSTRTRNENQSRRRL